MATFVEFICNKFKTTYSALTEFLSAGARNYTAHTQKTKGKVRTVFKPSEYLQGLQAAVITEVFRKFPVSAYSTAYEPGCSILKNAKKHQKSKYLVRYDVKDFFGSISYLHFERLLGKKYDSQDIKLLWRICSLNESLPVGASSSPFIVNRILYGFDKKMGKKFDGVVYTRYADDMVFSSRNPLPDELERELKGELWQVNLELNVKKTQRFGEKSPKKVTGITINPDSSLSVGKRYKKAIKKQLYDFITKKKGSKKKIIGRLNYIRFVSPSYFNKLVIKYDLENTLFMGRIKPAGASRNPTPRSPLDRSYITRPPLEERTRAPAPMSGPRLLVLFVIIAVICSFAISLGAALTILNDRPPKTIEKADIVITTDNYSEYLTLGRSYAVGADYTEFSVYVMIKNRKYTAVNLTVDFRIVKDGTQIYSDTVYFDNITNFQATETVRFPEVYAYFSTYDFQFYNVSGTLTEKRY